MHANSKLLALLLGAVFLIFQGGQAASWKNVAGDQPDDWFKTDRGIRVTQQVIRYQFPSGGWPKNINMSAATTNEAIEKITSGNDHSTIDNGATYSQIHFLCKAHNITGNPQARQSSLKGLHYLFESQYPTGGWPVYYPRKGSYYGVVHYNDNSVVGVLQLLKDITDGKPEFEWLPQEMVEQSKRALRAGIDCILRSQVVVEGARTVWCAQHDPATLAPAAARAFEPISLSGAESAYLTLFLMSLPNPDSRVIGAVEAAVDWFRSSAIDNADVKEVVNSNGERDRVFVRTEGKGPLWARFYEIGGNRPIFAGRDRVIHYEFDQIEIERRTGYAYFSTAPQKVLKAYPEWKATLPK